MEKSKKPIVIWLLSGAFLVASMVVIGGITRLTHSGLSMVEWNLVMGSVPPLNEAEWLEVFGKYQQTPEYQIVNTHFELEDFKSIFWWEYIHRLLGRMIGLVFLIPFAVFLIRKKIDRVLFRKLLFIFLLGAFQGFLGWFMVKSGLIKDPHVSHYRLAAHLVAALTLLGLIWWVAMDLMFGTSPPYAVSNVVTRLKKLILAGFILLVIQIIYGAFVAGLKAGLYYNTWPLMGNVWIPGEVINAFNREGIPSALNNITVVQFIHRYLGWLVTVMVVWIFLIVRRSPIGSTFKTGTFVLLSLTTFQITLGIFTLIYRVPVVLGVLHQSGAILLIMSFLFLIHRVRSITLTAHPEMNIDHSSEK